MVTEIERDANAVFQALYTWSVGDNDPNIGRYEVTTQELLKVTRLTYERLKDVVTLLEENGDLEAQTTLGGLQKVAPTARGRVRFQQIAVGGVSDTMGDSADDIEHDVFLSHSSYDDELAKEVKQLLGYNGIKTFATPSSIIKGKWERQIERALQKSANIWVLLTQDALKESVWAHQELGYFYGFRHGHGQDPEGERCRYLFTRGTPMPGLYGHFQGTEVESFDEPAVVAETIAKAMQRSFKLPADYQRQPITSARLRVATPQLQDGQEHRAAVSDVLAEIKAILRLADEPDTMTKNTLVTFSMGIWESNKGAIAFVGSEIDLVIQKAYTDLAHANALAEQNLQLPYGSGYLTDPYRKRVRDMASGLREAIPGIEKWLYRGTST